MGSKGKSRLTAADPVESRVLKYDGRLQPRNQIVAVVVSTLATLRPAVDDEAFFQWR